MQILVPLALFLVIGFLFAGVAARQENESRRIGFALAGMIILSVIVGSITYPLGGYYLRALAHEGNEEIREFIGDIESTLEEGNPDLAKVKIEFLLKNWEDAEFIEKESDWGTYIGDLVEQSKSINETRPIGIGLPITEEPSHTTTHTGL